MYAILLFFIIGPYTLLTLVIPYQPTSSFIFYYYHFTVVSP